MRLLLVLLALDLSGEALKFLAFSPLFAKSHVNFMAKISDVLVDAGHEVVILSETYDTSLGGHGTEKARIIQLPHSARSLEFEELINNGIATDSWADTTVYELLDSFSGMFAIYAEQCVATLSTPGLLDELRAAQFDAGYVESFHGCAPILFHMLGIDKFAITDSLAMLDSWFHYTQTPSNPAYVPGVMSSRSGDQMSFLDRAHNTYVFLLSEYFRRKNLPKFEGIIAKSFPGLPPVQELTARNSLVFTNSEPLVDFPRPSSSRIIDIGGIVVSAEHAPLNGTWSAILDLRPRTIFISFGTVAKAHLMPEAYKRSILEVIRSFPDVTFIWKYERPEHNISRGTPNLIESTWVPQRDILHDPRLSAFVTHCGQGSTTEAIDAGLPLIVIPVLADQYRNARQLVRNGIGIMLEKAALASERPLREAVSEILGNEGYRARAVQTRKMIAERPFPMREVFVRHMEFLAAHGPLRQLDHAGAKLTFAQYYLLDVIGAVIFVSIASLISALLIIRQMVRHLSRFVTIKLKAE